MKRQYGVNAASGLLILYGSAVMGGWLLQIPFWKAISPIGTLMVFPTALCFVMMGIGLAAPQFLPRQARVIRIAVGCAVASLSLLMLAENIFSTDLGVDLAAIHRWYPDNNPHPGRMAPNTAIAFLLASAALMFGTAHRRIGPMFYVMPAATATLGLLGLAGYTLLFDLAYGWYDIPRMAFTTAIGMVILGTGLILEHQDAPRFITFRISATGPNATDDARAYTFIGIAITILAMVVFLSYGSIKALLSRAAWVEHSAEIRVEFESMMALEAQGYNAWKSSLVTRDPESVKLAISVGTMMSEHLGHLQQLTGDNPVQQKRLAMMLQLISTNDNMLIEGSSSPPSSIRKQSSHPETPNSTLVSNRQQFEALVDDFRHEEIRLLAQRQQESQESAATTTKVILIGNLLGFAILFYAAWLMKRLNSQRDQLRDTLQSTNNFLDSLLENLPVGVFVKDAKDLRYVRINKAG